MLRNWSTTDRLYRSIAMRSNRNAVAASFSAEIERTYSDNPAAIAWLTQNRKAVDGPCDTGAYPLSETELRKWEELPLFEEFLNGNEF